MSRNLYVLSNPLIQKQYKIGVHKGSLSALKSRYGTAIPNVKVDLFIENLAARSIEQEFLKKHRLNRIAFEHSSRLSEWVDLSLPYIEDELLAIGTAGRFGMNDHGSFKIGSYTMSSAGRTKIYMATH